jgi:hypothetical protein
MMATSRGPEILRCNRVSGENTMTKQQLLSAELVEPIQATMTEETVLSIPQADSGP